ncbi:hypothetical protein CC86DRAFT_406704 [Ophiobolus disseminans]|uniref:Uncharacterized protein n=1 Tax=Ophiobolus disseminans TaxID=1469910 RepID=A0A6A7A0X2_9PLEO|nr:hypothetical protein CC86DRAFT_406704 [Ophiobolus disseminans]
MEHHIQSARGMTLPTYTSIYKELHEKPFWCEPTLIVAALERALMSKAMQRITIREYLTYTMASASAVLAYHTPMTDTWGIVRCILVLCHGTALIKYLGKAHRNWRAAYSIAVMLALYSASWAVAPLGGGSCSALNSPYYAYGEASRPTLWPKTTRATYGVIVWVWETARGP